MPGDRRGAPDLPPGPARELTDVLRRLRTSSGHLSLGQIAIAAGRSRGHTCEVISGWKHPSPDTAEAIARAMGADSVTTARARRLAEELAELTSYQRSARRADRGPGKATGQLCSGLPPDSAHFHGREAELREAISLLRGPAGDIFQPIICAVSGMPGVGKTAFSVKVANSVAENFADGCLFIDLHGFTGSVAPLSPADALDRMLRRLGLDAEQIPPQLDERTARLRQLLADRKILIVLDNARDSDQVKPLLPVTADARVLITSRFRLVSLDDAHHVTLPVLTRAAAGAVFSSVARLGPVASHGPFGELVDACGGLPLALHILAARCRHGSPEIVAGLGARMRDEWSRLDEIDDGERAVAAAFHVSAGELPARTRAVFTVLGLLPGADWSVHAAAALANLDVPAATRELEQLANAHLVERDWHRYRFHDLVRAYVRRLALVSLPHDERSAALLRLLNWAQGALIMADTLITPHRYRPTPAVESRSYAIPPLSGYEEAVDWVFAEQDNLVELCRYASEHRLAPFSWQLAYELRGFFFLTKQWDAWILTHSVALAGATAAGDPAAEAVTRSNLGLALMEKGNLDLADEHFLAARDLFELSRDEHGVSNAVANHASVLHYRGDYRESLRLNESVFEFYQRQGASRNAAITLRSIALNEIELGRPAAAAAHLETALASFADLHLPIDEAMAMNCLSEAHLRSRAHAEAARWSLLALDRAKSCGSQFEQARAYRNLGQVALDAGHHQQAALLWRHALRIYAALHAPEADIVRAGLAAACGVTPG